MADLNPDARVEADEVKEIFETDLSDGQVNAFINTAHLLVAEEISNQGLSEDRLTEIEKYLAAHFSSLRDPRVSRETTGGYSYDVQGRTDLGLDATLYGQQVKLLDKSGRLSAASMPKQIASIEVLSED